MAYDAYGNNGYDNMFSSSQSGGFMSPSQNTAQQFNSPGGVKRREAQTLTPVSIRQIIECVHENGKWKIDGKDVTQITLVGVVMSVDVKQTHITYTIDDSTGQLSIKLYVDNDDFVTSSSSSLNGYVHPAKIGENTYVRVIGNLARMSDQKNIVAFSVLPIHDMNEITFHALETIAVHLRNTRGAPQASIVADGVKTVRHVSPDASMGVGAAAPSSHGAGGANLMDEVLQAFAMGATATSGNGCSIHDVVQRLAHYSFEQVKNAVEHLSNEGHLYSTIDEDHYKCTASS